ncbi:Transmembrane protein 65 [Perkinsus chesapeaki]|uniref:Transmembrane protein 65 n=1 Tax=Perkinsus chesapeaki TaxID=330153 RepID=A0A7J6MX54_PERCH|nr:Transmembrane protein 65 [Perkinsus chesapeaki]
MNSDRIRRRVSESLLAKIEDQLTRRASEGSYCLTDDKVIEAVKSEADESVVSCTSESAGEMPTMDNAVAGSGRWKKDEDIEEGTLSVDDGGRPERRRVSAEEPPRSDNGKAITGSGAVGRSTGSSSPDTELPLFTRRPSLLAFARQASKVAKEFERTMQERNKMAAAAAARKDSGPKDKASAMEENEEELTSRIQKATRIGYGIGRLSEIVDGLCGPKSELARAWRTWVKAALAGAISRLRWAPVRADPGNYSRHIPRLNHLFSAMYEAQLILGVSRLHALLDKALHRRLRDAMKALSIWARVSITAGAGSPNVSSDTRSTGGRRATDVGVANSLLNRETLLGTLTMGRRACSTVTANTTSKQEPSKTSSDMEDIAEFLALARDDLNLVAKDLAESNTIDKKTLQWMQKYRVSHLSDTPEKANQVLKWTFICSAIPFIGFGILDNSLMLIFGEQIDNSLCVVMGTLAAAALGNAFSDLAGVFAGSHIEHHAELYRDLILFLSDCSPAVSRGIKVPQVSLQTQRSPRFKMAKSFGQAAGLFFGCLLGMAPLLWLDPLKAERTRLQNKRREIFEETIDELCKILDAKSGVLMLVDKEKNELFSETGGSKGVFRSPIDQDNAGIMGYVAATGQMVNIEDVSKTDFYNKRRHDDYHGHGFEAGSIICMPIFDSLRNVVGVVELAKSRHSGRTFSEKDEDLLAAMSSHIATYLHGTDGPQGFKAVLHACSSNMLVKSSRILLSQQQREERLFADVMHEVKRIMKAEAAMLMLMDDSSPDQPPVLYTKYCEGIDFSETTPVGVGIMGHVAQTGKPFIIDDVTEAGDLYDPERHENYKGTGKSVRSVMCVPIFDTRRRVIGVIEVINKKSPRGEADFFTERDKDILGNIANHVALNLEGTGSSLRKACWLMESPLVVADLYRGYEATSPIAPVVTLFSRLKSPRKEYAKTIEHVHYLLCDLDAALSHYNGMPHKVLESPFVRESKTEMFGLGFVELLLTSAIVGECAIDLWAQGGWMYFFSLWHVFDFCLAVTSVACLAAEAVVVRSLPERPAAMLIMLRYGMMVARVVKFAHDACSAQTRVRVARDAVIDFSKLPSDDDRQWLTGALLAAEPLLKRLLNEVYLNNRPEGDQPLITECPKGFGKLFLLQNIAEQLTSPDTVQHTRGMEILSGELREAFGFSAEFAKVHLSETLLRQAWELRREPFRELINLHLQHRNSLPGNFNLLSRVCPLFMLNPPPATLLSSLEPLGLPLHESSTCEFVIGPLDTWRLLPGDVNLMKARLSEAVHLLQARPDVIGVSMRSKLLDEYTNSELLAALFDPDPLDQIPYDYLLLQLGLALRGIPEILAGIRDGVVEIPGVRDKRQLVPCGFDLACSSAFLGNFTGDWSTDVWLRRLGQPEESSPLLAISRGIFRHTNLESVVDIVPPYEFDIRLPEKLDVFIAPVDVVVPCREMFGWLLVDMVQSLSLALTSFRHDQLHLVLPELIHVFHDSRWTTDKPLDDWPLIDAVQEACRMTGTEERIPFDEVFDVDYFTQSTGVPVVSWNVWGEESLDWLIMLRDLPLPGGYTEGVVETTGPHIPCRNATGVNRIAILFGKPVLVKNTLCVASTTNASWNPYGYRSGLESILSSHDGRTVNIGFYFYFWLGGERSRMTMSSARVSTSMVMPSLWRSIRFSPALQQLAASIYPGTEYVAVHWRWRNSSKLLRWPKTSQRLIPTWTSPEKERQFHLAQPQSFARLVFNALPSSVRCYHKFFLMTNIQENSSHAVEFEDELRAIRKEQCPSSSPKLQVTVGNGLAARPLPGLRHAGPLVLEMAIAARAQHFVGFADGWIAGTASVLTLIVTQLRIHHYDGDFDSTTFAFDGGNEYLT